MPDPQGPATGPIITDIDETCDSGYFDEYAHTYGNIYIVTVYHCFGHIQDLDKILKWYGQEHKKIIIFDNAATLHIFNGINLNLGHASYIYTDTKILGFGEGGLAINKSLIRRRRKNCL